MLVLVEFRHPVLVGVVTFDPVIGDGDVDAKHFVWIAPLAGGRSGC